MKSKVMKFLLFSVVSVLILLGALFYFLQSPAIAPYIYTIY